MKYSSLIFAASAVLAVPTPSAAQDGPLGFYVALQSTGILGIDFDPSKDVNHSLTITSTTNAGFQVNWITPYEDKIYSISRSHYPDNATMSGGVFEFEEASEMDLILLGSRSSNGEGGVFLDVSPDGKTLAAANIDGGSVSIFPLSSTGTIGAATYTFQYTIETPGPGAGDSQTQANPHESIFDPSGKYIFVPDRGADRVYIYNHGGPSAVTLLETLTLEPGTGPRHILFSPIDHQSFYFYLVSELENCIRTFVFSCKGSTAPKITQLQIISTLGLATGLSARTAPTNDDLAAELQLSSDGRFMYVSNRNTQTFDPDTIAIFSRDITDGTLTYLTAASTQGKLPRMFAISPDATNQYVAVANEVTQDITMFERDAGTGMIGEVVGRLVLGEIDATTTQGPLCVLWQ
ncbi:hypothetical protein H2200_004315 [Cladophialophora chaetospira]|uniref:6-phosphogluconolactonase n=1 Tax=Cladophialophora chaetospira TaxID=386627 RepID=A0AA39CJC8_9EURO|nr:hypothetical protein H2200_004315 [Cladophialophora chaetospira]